MRFSILVLIAGLLVLVGCDNSHDAEKNHQASRAEASDSQTSPQPAAPTGPLKSHEEKLKRIAAGCDGKDCPTVTIKWVVFDNQKALNQSIHRHLITQLSNNREPGKPVPSTLKDVAKAFLSITDNLPEGASDHWQLSGEATRLSRHGNLLTVEISSYEFTGGAHGMPATQWLNWDLARNKTVPLSAIIKPGQSKAFWDLARQAHEQWLEDETDADDDFRKAWPFQKTTDYRLTDDGVVLLYGVYAIGPYAMGEAHLVIPWKQASAAVREQYKP